MKTLKLKSVLFGLIAILAIAVLVTSCEQEAIHNLKEDISHDHSEINMETGVSCSDCMMYSDQEPDEIIDVLIKYSENDEPVTEKAARYGEVVVYGGDVVLTENYSSEISLRGNVISDFSRLWPNSTIPYVWGDGLSQTERTQILAAIQDVNGQTNLCVVERTNETAFVQIRGTDAGCYVTRIGNDGTGNQIINLGPGCFTNHTIIHEILHKAGFYHEQTRPDRDNFITVNWGNLDGNWRFQFQRQGGETNSGDYDFASIMHYVQFHSSVTIDDTQPMYFINNPNDLPSGMTANQIGRLQNMSATDIGSVNALYPTCGGAANSLSWNPPSSIINGNNQVTVDYSINQNGIVLVQVFNSDWELIGQVYQYVSPGAAQLTLTLPANTPSPTNNHLQAKLLNSGWSDIGVPQLYENLPGNTPPPPPPSSDCEVLSNGNFDSSLSNWEPWGCNAYASGGAANITGINTGAYEWDAGLAQRGVTLEYGKTYTVTFRARANSNRSITYKAGLSESPWTAYFYETANISTSMQTYTHTFTMNNATNTNASFEFFFGTNSSNVYIESASVEESNCGGTNTCEVLTNGDFNSNLSNWNAWNCNAYISGGAANITSISTGADPWYAGLNQVGFTVQQGKTYTVTFRARAASNRSIIVKAGISDEPWTSYFYETINLTTSMQTYTITFTMNYSTDTNSRFEFFFGTNSSNVYIDNVSMSEDC